MTYFDLTPYPLCDETENEATAPDGHNDPSQHVDCSEAALAMVANWANHFIPASPQTREALDRAHSPVDTPHATPDNDVQALAVFGRVPSAASTWTDLKAELDTGLVVAAVTGWYLNWNGTRGGHRVAIGPRLAPDAYVFRDPMGFKGVATWAQVMWGGIGRWGGVWTITSNSAPRYVHKGEWNNMDFTGVPTYQVCDVIATGGSLYLDADSTLAIVASYPLETGVAYLGPKTRKRDGMPGALIAGKAGTGWIGANKLGNIRPRVTPAAITLGIALKVSVDPLSGKSTTQIV